MLQIPPGVGTLLMQNLETTFKVPRAVWREMNLRRDELVAVDGSGVEGRMRELLRRIGTHIRG